MPNGNLEKLPHLLVTGTGHVEPYVTPPARGKEPVLPGRDRAQHGQKLLAQLAELQEEAQAAAEEQRARGIDVGNGLVIQFESEPEHELAIKSLEYQPSGIELLAVREIDGRRIAAVFVPEGKLSHFIKRVNFPDRTVLIASGTRAQMSRSADLLNSVAELRRAKQAADFFAEMPAVEQFEWIEDALRRITPPQADSPAVCILDTGVNNAHPLLSDSLAGDDMHSYHPDWNTADHDGHGTEMAGLALYGDLTELLASTEGVELRHRLESVKILPPRGDNPPHLYGAITAEAAARAEVAAPTRKRVFSMSVTTRDFRDRGKPSAWSAKLDAVCSGADEEGDQRRLICGLSRQHRASDATRISSV